MFKQAGVLRALLVISALLAFGLATSARAQNGAIGLPQPASSDSGPQSGYPFLPSGLPPSTSCDSDAFERLPDAQQRSSWDSWLTCFDIDGIKQWQAKGCRFARSRLGKADIVFVAF